MKKKETVVEKNVEEVQPTIEQAKRVNPFAAWDELMFMRRKPLETDDKNEK